MERKSYPSDFNDAEWQITEPLIPPAETGGRPHEARRSFWRLQLIWADGGYAVKIG